MFILPDFFWVRISLRNILFGFSTNYFRGLGLRIRVMEGWFGEKNLRKARLRWYGHLRRKDDGY